MIRFVEQRVVRVSRELAVVKSFGKVSFLFIQVSSEGRIFWKIYSLVEED